MNQRFFSSARFSINLNGIGEISIGIEVYICLTLKIIMNIIFNTPKSCFRQGEFLWFVAE